MTTSCSISVAARVRPTTVKPAQIRVDRYSKKIHLRAGESDELLEYEFDQVFDQESSQEQVLTICHSYGWYCRSLNIFGVSCCML